MKCIDYIAGVPGLGKTRWAVNELADACIRGTGAIIYVAPTRRLILQVIESLLKELKTRGVSAEEASNRIVRAFSTTSKVRQYTVADGVKAAIEGTDLHGSLVHLPTFNSHSVVFMTHEGFYGLPYGYLGRKLKSSISVIFDEAKKSVFVRAKIKLENKSAALFNSFFTKERYRSTGYYRLHIDLKTYSAAKMKKVTSSINDRRQHLALQTIVRDAQNPLLEVYVSTSEIKSGTRFYGISLPSRVFHGYKRVVMMAAYFEDSQMYHLLNSDPDVVMRDITHTLPNVRKRTALIKTRYAEAILVPLTLQEDVISLNQLSGTMVPKESLKSIGEKMKKLSVTTKHLPTVFEYLETGYPTDKEPRNIQRIVKYIKTKRLVTDSMSWYLKKAATVSGKWRAKYPSETQPIVFVNNAYTNYVDLSCMTQVSTASHGLNHYSAHNIAIFLAAINPDRQTANFMKARVGDAYDYRRDFVVDICLQSVSRTSVRDTNSKSRILIILPDSKLTAYVHEKMFGLPAVDNRWALSFGDYSPLTVMSLIRENEGLNTTAKEKAKRAVHNVLRNRNAQSKYLDNPLNKRLSRLRVDRNYIKKKGEKDADYKKYEMPLKLAEIESQILILTKQRDTEKRKLKEKKADQKT